MARVRKIRETLGLSQEAFAERAGLKYKHYQSVEAGRKLDLKLPTLEKLAKACGLTKGQMSKIENGHVSSPLSTIERISRVLEVDPGNLLRRRDGRNWHVMRRAELEERRSRLKTAHHHYEQLFSDCCFESSFQPMHGCLRGPSHLKSFRYPGAVYIIILKGRVIYEYSKEKITLGPGDIFYCDGRKEHGPIEILQGPVDYLLVLGNIRA